MQLQWTEAQDELRAQYAGIAEEASRGLNGEGRAEFDQRTWDRLVAAGLWRMIVPESYGGQSEDWWGFTAALEGLASRIRAPGLLLSVIAQAGMVRALSLHGTEMQKRRYFPRILAGVLTATAIADPDSGTDVRSTSSVLTPGPNETFLLNGRKYNIAHAPVADFVLVVCKLEGQGRKGISLCVVECDNCTGLTLGPPDDKLGDLDLPTGEMTFENIRLDYTHLLGVPGEGLRNLVRFVSLGRVYYGLVAAWLLEPMLKEAMDYVRERTTFGVPIAEHQYVQKKLTDMRLGIETTRWVSYAALGQLLTGDPRAAMMCSVAKITGADTVTGGALDLLRLYGSRGYHQNGITTFLRDALAFCSVGGTEEMHRRNIYSQMTRQHLMRSAPVQDIPDAASMKRAG